MAASARFARAVGKQPLAAWISILPIRATRGLLTNRLSKQPDASEQRRRAKRGAGGGRAAGWGPAALAGGGAPASNQEMLTDPARTPFPNFTSMAMLRSASACFRARFESKLPATSEHQPCLTPSRSTGRTPRSTSPPTCRCSGCCATFWTSRAPSSAAASASAARARCTWTARRSGPVRCRSPRRGCTDHDHRRPLGRRVPSRAARLGGARRAAMRLLPGRPDHVGGGAAGAQPEPDRRRHRHGDERQYLPLRDLLAHSPGDSPRGCARRRPGETRRPGRALGADSDE